MNDITIPLPLRIKIGYSKKKRKDEYFSLNLNTYRNAHFIVLNKAKKAYSETIRDWFIENEGCLHHYPRAKLTYVLFKGTKRRVDLGNVGPIVGKFTEDALVDLGIMDDDSDMYVPHIEYKYGGLCRGNPRMDLKISRIY